MIEIHEIEELVKSVNKHAIKAFLRNAAILKDPSAPKEMKELAEANVRAISQNKPLPKPTKDKPVTTKSTPKQKTPLDEAIAQGKSKMSSISNDKIKANVARAEAIKAGNKAEVAADRDAKRKEERKKELLPGSDHTLKELQTAADRTTRDPNALKEGPLARRMQTPDQAAKQATAKKDSTIKNALDLAHQLHGSGDVDAAHSLITAIPREHMPQELKHYNPAYLHYNITPDMWSKLPSDHQEHVHGFHNDVMTGVHNESPDPTTKAMASKVQNLLKPSTS